MRFFLQGILATGTTGEKSIRLRARALRENPTTVCTVRDYDGLDDLRAFLGPQRFKDFVASYRMDDNKGGVIVVHDKHIVVIDTSPLAFSTAKTACFKASNLSLVFSGRRLELQAPQ